MADAQATQFNSEWAVLEQSSADPVTEFSIVLYSARTRMEMPLAKKSSLSLAPMAPLTCCRTWASF